MWITKKQIEEFNSEIDSLKLRLWKLENPAKYKAGDNIFIGFNELMKKPNYTIIGEPEVKETWIYATRYIRYKKYYRLYKAVNIKDNSDLTIINEEDIKIPL